MVSNVNTKDFSLEFVRLRKDAGFKNAAEVATKLRELGYSAPTYFMIRRYELGEAQPLMSQFAALVHVLGLSQRETLQLVRACEPERQAMPKLRQKRIKPKAS